MEATIPLIGKSLVERILRSRMMHRSAASSGWNVDWECGFKSRIVALCLLVTQVRRSLRPTQKRDPFNFKRKRYCDGKEFSNQSGQQRVYFCFH